MNVNLIKRYFGPEDHIQYKIVQYINLNYKYALFTHPQNEFKRGWVAQTKAKALGVCAGVPDILIFNPSGKYAGLAIECKAPKGKVTKHQSFWLAALHARGWRADVVRSFEDGKKVLDEYFSEKSTTTI